jgi:hypothetical protein
VGVLHIRARDWEWERLESLPGWGSKPHYAINRAPSLPVIIGGVYIFPQKPLNALSCASYSVFSRGPKQPATDLPAKAENLTTPAEAGIFPEPEGAWTWGGVVVPHVPHVPHGPGGQMDTLID